MNDPTRGRAPFRFDLQQFAEEDDLPQPQSIDVSALSDDPAQLKRLIGTMQSDLQKVHREAGNRRVALRKTETEFDTLKTQHAEYRTAAGDRDAATLKTDLEKFKTDLETSNRSNGQLRSKFREQFVDSRVRTELEKRGAKNVDDAMKLLDVSKIEFDEEKLEVKDPAALTTTLDEFAKAREYLFGAPAGNGNGNVWRGTTPGRGASDTPAGGGGGSKDVDKNLSPEDAMVAILGDLS